VWIDVNEVRAGRWCRNVQQFREDNWTARSGSRGTRWHGKTSVRQRYNTGLLSALRKMLGMNRRTYRAKVRRSSRLGGPVTG